MDGVLADFHKAYYAGRVRDGTWDKVRFREMVLQNQIFEDLDFMPNAVDLLNFTAEIRDSHNVKIEILTSVGTFDVEQGNAARNQKLKWLMKNNIGYKANFVRTKSEKAQYATPTSILIDDSIGCIQPFNAAGGHGILHEDAEHEETLYTFERLVNALHGLALL
jgi:hypothetical protein